jgi:DNA-directed RNA polymerase specialized sigma24 family protein
MNNRDLTDMGGPARGFQATPWSLIDQIHASDQAGLRGLINDLMRLYWKPVYCFLRQKGYPNEEAKDITQGFFQEVVLGRCLLDKADPNQGRFRTLLLTSLERHVASLHRKQKAQKRIPIDKIIPLDVLMAGDVPDSIHGQDQVDSFNYAWLTQVLDRVLADVENQCRTDGIGLHWQVFSDRVLDPLLRNLPSPSMEEICLKHRISRPVEASNMIVTVKRRFQSALRREIRHSVSSDLDIEAELRELLNIPAKPGARDETFGVSPHSKGSESKKPRPPSGK